MALRVNGIDYWTLSQVATELGITRQTIWRWRQKGSIAQGQRYRGREVLFTQAEVHDIQQYANRLEPIGLDNSPQRSLFDNMNGE